MALWLQDPLVLHQSRFSNNQQSLEHTRLCSYQEQNFVKSCNNDETF